MNPRPDSPDSTHRLAQPKHLLVRGVNWLGDAVMTTPALARLREALPDTRIVLLTVASLAELWEHHPSLDEVIPFTPGATPWQIASRLRSAHFDCGLILPNSPRAALEMFLAGIPRRIGAARPWRNWLLTDRVQPRPLEVRMRKRLSREIKKLIRTGCPSSPPSYPQHAHHLYQYLHLAAKLGAREEALAPHLEVTPAEITQAKEHFLPGGEQPPVWLGLNAGAEYGPAKRWPAERFVQMARQVSECGSCGWILFGGPKEASLAGEIERALRQHSLAHVVNLAGRTSLRQLCACLKLCRVVVTNDTGPMHVAAAVGTPVVALFGSTSPELTGPGDPGDQRTHRLILNRPPCSPCFLRECPVDFRCLRGISVDPVVKSVLDRVTLS